MYGETQSAFSSLVMAARFASGIAMLGLALWSQPDCIAQSLSPVGGEKDSETQVTESVVPEPTVDPQQIEDAIDRLGDRKYAQRQSAYRLLVKAGVTVIEELECSAASPDLDIAERCVRALSEIALDDEVAGAAIDALERLSEAPGNRVAMLAKSEVDRLKMTDEDRAIAALEASGVRVHRTANGEIFSVSLTKDQEVRWLKFLPSLRSVNLMNANITDKGIQALLDCDQIQSVSLYQTAATDVGLGQLHQMSSLTSISLSGNQFTENGIRTLKKAQGLRSLFWNAPVSTEQLRAIVELKQIRILNLRDVPASEEATELLNQLDYLSALSLATRDADDDLCNRISKIKVDVTLSLMVATKVTSKGWQDISTMNLKSLRIYKSSLSDSEMPLIGQIKTLTSLSIYDSPVTDEGIPALKNLKDLHSLSFQRTQVTQEGAGRLQEALPKLRSLRVDSIRIGGNRIPAPAVPRAPQAGKPFGITTSLGRKNIHLRAPLTKAVFDLVKKEKDVHTVFLTRSRATDSCVTMIAKLPIKRLVVDSDSVGDQALEALKNHASLESVSLASKQLTDASLDAMTTMPALNRLCLMKSQFSDEGIQRLIKGLAKTNKLSSLELSVLPNITDEALRDLKQLQKLSMLQFNNNPNSGASVLRYVCDVSAIREIRIDGGPVTAEDINHLRGHGVERIVLGESKFGPKAISALVEACPKLQSLSLAKSSVVDDDLLSIGKLEELQWLWLYGTKVGDEGLKHLDGLKKLQTVYVNAATVSEEGERRFKEKHPNANLNKN